jgi:hypothetical protein
VADCTFDDDGNPATPEVPLTTDQRGISRPQGVGCDIGAFEFQSIQTCVQPPAGLLSWWPLDETSGTTAMDIMNGNDGTHVGGPTPVTGMVAGALSFDGIDDKVVVNAMFPFHQLGDATLEFWLNTPAAADQQEGAVFWTRPDDEDANRFNIFVRPGSTLHVDYRSPSGELHELVSEVSIPRDTWIHVAITRTGNDYNLYVNGVLAGSGTDTAPDLPTTTGWQMSGRGGFMYHGSLDEVTLYNRALSADEVAAIFHAGSAGKCKAPSLCTLDLTPSLTEGMLTLDVQLGTQEPATWNIWLTAQNEIVRLLSVPLGVLDPPVSVPFTIPFVPSLGTVGVLTTLTTPDHGIICSAFETVETGSSAEGVASSTHELQDVLQHIVQ